MSCCRVFRINNDVKKRIVVAFGRYQPPHCGHKTIFDDMISMINDPNNIADEGYIYVMGFPPQPNERNPLGPNEKLKYLNKMLPNTQIKFIIGNSVGERLSPEIKTLLRDRLIIMPLPTKSELAERKELGDKYPYLTVANLYKLHFWFKDREEENDYMIIAGEDRVSQIKKANKTSKLKYSISEAGQKRSAAAQTGDVCTVDDSPSGSRIRHLALSIDSFYLNDPKVKQILSFTKLGNMTDEDVFDMVNDIRKVNNKPEIYYVTGDEIMLGGRRKTRKKRRKTKRKTKRKKRGGTWVGEVCPICQEKMKRSGATPIVQTTGCVGDDGINRPHTFHLNCINEWLNRGNITCPMCRHVINSGDDLRIVYPTTCSDKCKQKLGKLWEDVKEKIKNIRERRQQARQQQVQVAPAAPVDFNAINRESHARQEDIIMGMINRPPQQFDAARDAHDIVRDNRGNLFRRRSGGKKKYTNNINMRRRTRKKRGGIISSREWVVENTEASINRFANSNLPESGIGFQKMIITMTNGEMNGGFWIVEWNQERDPDDTYNHFHLAWTDDDTEPEDLIRFVDGPDAPAGRRKRRKRKTKKKKRKKRRKKKTKRRKKKRKRRKKRGKKTRRKRGGGNLFARGNQTEQDGHRSIDELEPDGTQQIAERIVTQLMQLEGYDRQTAIDDVVNTAESNDPDDVAQWSRWIARANRIVDPFVEDQHGEEEAQRGAQKRAEREILVAQKEDGAVPSLRERAIGASKEGSSKEDEQLVMDRLNNQ